MNNLDTYSSYTLLRLLLIRIATIGLYLAAYKNIGEISRIISELLSNPVSFLLIVYETKDILSLGNPIIRQFTLIFLLSATFIPIIRTLMREIDTNTIFFWFSICQCIFCIDSVRMAILNKLTSKKPKFTREETIPLEESILIPLKMENNGIFGNMAALLSFFALFSRMNSNKDVFILFVAGFVIYLFVPYFIEESLVYQSTRRVVQVLSSFLILQFLADQETFYTFLYIIATVSLFWILSISIIEWRHVGNRDGIV